MSSPQLGDIVRYDAVRETPADPAEIAASVRVYLTDELKANPAEVLCTHEPTSHTITFSFPGCLTGSVRVNGARSLSLTYIVANMWEYREHAEFETLDDFCTFFTRLIRLVRRFAHAALGSAST